MLDKVGVVVHWFVTLDFCCVCAIMTDGFVLKHCLVVLLFGVQFGFSHWACFVVLQVGLALNLTADGCLGYLVV